MSRKVLLVEDEESLRSSLEIILSNADFDVESCGDGKTALKLLQSGSYHAIILDDNIPFIQGSDLLGLIRVNNPDVKILVMSGLFDKDSVERVKKMGADVVIEKPFDFETVVDYIKS